LKLQNEIKNDDDKPSLLKTIKFPKKLKHLSARLPQANYDHPQNPLRLMSPNHNSSAIKNEK
jgi:hypothetical protein